MPTKHLSDCFPEQQALGKILRDSDVKAETVRRMLILLAFYKSQAQSKLNGDIENAGDRCNAYINQTLSESGFELFSVNGLTNSITNTIDFYNLNSYA